MKTYLTFAASLLLIVASSQAAVLMMDFGPTSIGTATNLSPYHSINPTAGTTWNSPLGTGDSSGTLLYADGTSATGVSYNLGVGSGVSTTSVLETAPGSSSSLGTAINAGIYGGTTSSGRDGIFNSTAALTMLTMQISGLAAGTYDIYYVGRNTNRGLPDNYTQNIFGASSSASGNFNWSPYNFSTITYGSAVSNTNTSTWVAGQNYAKLTVTVGSGEFLNLAFTGSGIEGRGFLNSLQIVSVPEPSSVLLTAFAGMVLAIGSRKRRRA